MAYPMVLKFWGVRGTTPVPGPGTVRYGGNTTCVSLTLGSDKILILDAGTGIRELGKILVKESTDIFMLVTHRHWDHIQGFPSFLPIYQPQRVINMFPMMGTRLACTLLEQMDGKHYPVEAGQLLSDHHFIIDQPHDVLEKVGFLVDRIELNHPGGGFGYRIENEGRSVVFLSDNELFPPDDPPTAYDDFVAFSRSADILIHDAQYLESDMPDKLGWGHSLVRQALELGRDADVKHLILTHHDPDRHDEALDEIKVDSMRWCERNAPEMQCTVAFEGLTIDL